MHAVLPVRTFRRFARLGRPEHRVQRQQHQRHQHGVRGHKQPAAAVRHHDDDTEEGVLEGHQGEVEGQGQWDPRGLDEPPPASAPKTPKHQQQWPLMLATMSPLNVFTQRTIIHKRKLYGFTLEEEKKVK